MPYTKKISFSFNHGALREIHNIDPTKLCPICNHAIEPIPISIALQSDNVGAIMLFCNACSKAFISYFSIQVTHADYYYFDRTLSSHPAHFTKEIFPKEITQISQKFVDIYNQAKEAESLGLNEICGMGYRKSLEFLIKDYAIQKKPEDKEVITSPTLQLSNCIASYISDPTLQTLAKAASWIGNDESHYSRRHSMKDVNDLKNFIYSVVQFIRFQCSLDDASRLLDVTN